MVFFLLFGTLLLHVFGVSLSMIRIVGGIILTRIGFQLFNPSPSGALIPTNGSGRADGMDIAFIPMAMPIMFGPGGIATLIGMAATMHLSRGDWKPTPPVSWRSWRQWRRPICPWPPPSLY